MVGASIILPAYVPDPRLLHLTQACLESLNRHTERDSYQLVIVDNGSYPQASAYLWGRHTYRDRHIFFDEPIGYARAANIGIGLADHDWLVVINTDIEFVQDDWLEILKRDYLATRGGVLSALDRNLCDGRAPQIYEDECWFSCWITRREIIEKVGYFDESIPHRFMDQDYAIRVKQAGYGVMRDGNVWVDHVDSATYGGMEFDEEAERQKMIDRWGAAHFFEWIAK